MASGLSGYIICCLQETFTVLWNVAHRQSETYDTQMNQNRIYCKQRSVHLLVVRVVRIHAALLRTNTGWISQRLLDLGALVYGWTQGSDPRIHSAVRCPKCFCDLLPW
jgi:hypothetical protein